MGRRLLQTKKFEGKLYHLYNVYKTESGANSDAGELRKKGKLARVVERHRTVKGAKSESKYWVVYFR